MPMKSWLNDHSSIIYLMPAIPTLIYYILLLYTSYVIRHYSDEVAYVTCSATDDGGVKQFLTGNLFKIIISFKGL